MRAEADGVEYVDSDEIQIRHKMMIQILFIR